MGREIKTPPQRAAAAERTRADTDQLMKRRPSASPRPSFLRLSLTALPKFTLRSQGLVHWKNDPGFNRLGPTSVGRRESSQRCSGITRHFLLSNQHIDSTGVSNMTS